MGDEIEIETWPNQASLFYRVSSNNLSLEVKGIGVTVIGLYKTPSKKCDIWVELDSVHSQSHIYCKDSQRVSTRTNNIMRDNEYSRIIICWKRNKLQLITPEKCLTNNSTLVGEINYFTLTTKANNRIINGIRWRFELPPPKPSTSMIPVASGQLEWKWSNVERVIPDGALIGGFEPEPLYIIRAVHRNSMTPGKLAISTGHAYVPWGGQEHCKGDYEVLIGYNATWVPTEYDKIPYNAFVAGHSEVSNEPLYIGRAYHNNALIPGKVQPSHRCCFIPYFGQDIVKRNYEILTVPCQNRYGAKVMMPLESSEDPQDDDSEQECELSDVSDEEDVSGLT